MSVSKVNPRTEKAEPGGKATIYHNDTANSIAEDDADFNQFLSVIYYALEKKYQERPGVLLQSLMLKITVGLLLLLTLGGILSFILNPFVFSLLTRDGVSVLLFFFGYIAVVIVSAFSQWAKDASGPGMPTDHRRDEPENYAPGVPPKSVYHGS